MSACPHCFQQLPVNQSGFRCISGRCEPAENTRASELAGYPVRITPFAIRASEGQAWPPPPPVPCMRCRIICQQEICPTCYQDIEPGWRNKDVFTVAITGARGSGKSVYITVLTQWLLRFALKRGRTMTAHDQSTRDVYGVQYYGTMYGSNKCLDGTRPISDGEDAYQRRPLIWRLSAPKGGKELFLVIRDMAGEDLEGAQSFRPQFHYVNFADLTVFLFDPMTLYHVVAALEGLIPQVDADRLGQTADQVLANLLAQCTTPQGRLALTISKFDALHQLPRANTPEAQIIANPAARFNRDMTFSIHPQTGDEMPVEWAFHATDVEFLDAEIRSLLARFHEAAVTVAADNAVHAGKVGKVRHFAVSSLGDTPVHREKLTVRGILPFRVLDPLLWALHDSGRWI